MATLARELLTADGLSVRIFCAGMSMVGIRLSGTWAGSVKFRASQAVYGTYGPGLGQPELVGVYTWPDKTVVTTAAGAVANGNYFWPVQNYGVFEATFTRTSGSALVTLASAIDQS